MQTKQHTLGGVISFSGKGLHTGVVVNMTVNPSGDNTGIVFRRIDLEGAPTVPALCEYVTDTSRGTTIENGEAKVSTIEHIVSALWTMGVDNALIDIDGPEAPIMDGSSREYVQRIEEVGIVTQKAERKYYEVTEKQVYTIPDKGVAIIIYPDDEFTVSVHVDYNSKVIGNQYATLDMFNEYKEKIAPCRTFVFLHDLEPLLKMNLIKGGDLDNAIVVVENPVSDEQMEHLKSIFNKQDIQVTGGYLNNLQLRSSNELACHKLLDLLGDFALLGMRIKGRVWASRPGHYANTEFMKQLLLTIRRDGEKPAFKYSPSKPALLDVNDICELLPHRYPFLMVDKVFHIDDKSIGAIKNVTANEPQFTGHFPQEPVMPGVLLVEALAQAGGLIVLNSVENPKDYSTYFLRIDNVRFKRKVVPGDTIQLEAHIIEPLRRGIASILGKVFVGGQLACEATLMAQIVKTKKSE